MASLFHCLLLFLILFSVSTAQKTSFRPKALVLRVTKDESTLQYYTRVAQRTPAIPIKLSIDLGSEFLWVDCENGYNSSTKKPVPCRSAQCSLSGSKACTSNTNPSDDVCIESPHNPFTNTGTADEFSQDIIYIQSTDGKNPGKVVNVPKFLFTCAPTFILEGLAKGAVGIAGLGGNKVSMPSLFSAAFSFPRKFAVCLSSSTSETQNGAVIFGDGPYVLSPGIDISKSLTYTPLVLNRKSLIGCFPGEASAEYFIGVRSIKVGGKQVPLNSTLLSFDEDGHGGTKISTATPYTTLETSIYKAVVDAFVKALGVPTVPAVSPFTACFSTLKIGSTVNGPDVPPIDFVLQSEKVVWRIHGANSLVFVGSDVACLGFVDGGPLHFVDWGIKFTPTAIVIGGHQIEDNLLQFDLATSRLGFSSLLHNKKTGCSSFNFTSIDD
ncbi:probable aspartic proteinase GIP2 [Humulus lupulus]|uniref:probable aspartic proteinase GIP2 n=1 Tax=Humulus lupulus TaxID=3486 RepID=UPI002B41838E|nr:probable aspartic proteinase GIP2 [Humulus lupulus]